MSDGQVCRHVIIKGIVQNVGFRDYTYRAAKNIGGLLGWVRNLDNGDVEILVQGPLSKIEEFIKCCHQGPPKARVDVVTATEVSVETGLGSFAIRRG